MESQPSISMSLARSYLFLNMSTLEKLLFNCFAAIFRSCYWKESRKITRTAHKKLNLETTICKLQCKAKTIKTDEKKFYSSEIVREFASSGKSLAQAAPGASAKVKQ